MDFFDTPYFKITKSLLSMMGIWPYQKPVSRYSIGTLAIVVVVISVTPIYWFTLYTTFAIGDLDAAIKCIPSYTLLAASQAKLWNLFFYRNNFKELLDIIKSDCKSMTNKKEKKVLLDYLKFGRKMTFFFCVYCYASLFIFGVSATTPKILNSIFLLSKKNPIYDPFYIEYYVDKEKYDLVYTIHTFIVSLGVTTIAIANDSLEFIIVQHACMKFKILAHRVRNVMQERRQHKRNMIRCGHKFNKERERKSEIQETTSERIILCIQEHNKIIEYVNLIQSKYSSLLTFIVVDTMVGFFITGFQVVRNFDRPPVAAKNGILLISKLIHVYVQNWIGQRLIDHSNFFSASVYKSPWIDMTIKERKLLFMLLLRSHRPCKITAGVLCAMSVENFKKVLTMSMSYFSVLNSLYTQLPS